MFKVGDKVKRISSGHPVESPIGVVRTVTAASNSAGWFGATEECSEGSRGCFERYWELVKTEPQAAAIAGGLQEHNVGEYYPLAAVMYEHNGKSIITIENLQTGEVAAIGGRASDWHSFESAYYNIENIAKGGNWLRTKGRVSYVNGRWVVAEPANPVRVTRLRNMLHRG